MRVFSFLYNVGIRIYFVAIFVASFFNDKAKLWIEGRKKQVVVQNQAKSVWFHCASLGEYEQALPLIEKIKSELPLHKIVVTFFSPSGFEVKKNHKTPDYVYYLPLDTQKNAAEFIQKVNPIFVFFVKYEFWNNYLTELKYRGVATFLFSANFRENQVFFKPYGLFFKEMLFKFNHIFVQNQKSLNLLISIGVKNSSLANDTRFDTVIATKNKASKFNEIEKFIGSKLCIVLGSSWLKDELLWIKVLQTVSKFKILIAPHDVNSKRIAELQDIFKDSVVHSKLNGNELEKQVLIIDSIGKLTQLYQYATLSYVGGGFDASIHNVLEPAVFGVPVLFGPNYKKSQEAIDLLNLGGAFAVKNIEELENLLQNLQKGNQIEIAGKISENYVFSNADGTQQIVEKLKELKFL